MRNIIILLITFTLSANIIAQEELSFEEQFSNSDAYLFEENYETAYTELKKLYQMDKENELVNFKLGFCCLHVPDHLEEAPGYLEKATQNTAPFVDDEDPTVRKAPIEAWYYLGKAYHRNYKLEKAIEAFNKFIDLMNEAEYNDILLEKQVRKEISEVEFAKSLMESPVELELYNLGEVVNSEYSDHSPVITADENTLIFTSKRRGSTGNFKLESGRHAGQYFEDIYISTREKNEWRKPIKMQGINTDGHEATIGLSPDGTELFIYRDDGGNGNIYISKKEGTLWSEPKGAGNLINTRADENHATLSPDKRTIIFTSNRKGGYGGWDLYKSSLLPTGEWGDVMNLGPNINTEYDEISPYFHPDGVTLFFSSNGHQTMGGFDVFFTNINEKGETDDVINLGYPVNTTGDDVFYTITADGKRAYYSSYKKGGYGYEDIYMIVLENGFRKQMGVATGIVTKADVKNSEDIEIIVTDALSGKDKGIFRPNTETGKYIMILPTDREYNVIYSAPGYETVEKTIKVSKDSRYDETFKAQELEIVELGTKYDIVRISFTPESHELSDEAKASLAQIPEKYNNKLIRFDNSGNTPIDKTKELRIFNTVDYLIKNGVDKSKIHDQAEQVKEGLEYVMIMFGETTEPQTEDIVADNQKIENKTKQIDNNAIKEKVTFRKMKIGFILFKYDNYSVPNYAYSDLNQLSAYLKRNKDAVIKISGYTDSKGTDKYNERLSFNRANSVKKYLIKKGVNKSNIILKKFGEKSPAGMNKTPKGTDNTKGRALNRRVTFEVLTQGKNEKLEVIPLNVKTVTRNEFKEEDYDKYIVEITSINASGASSNGDIDMLFEYCSGKDYRYFVLKQYENVAQDFLKTISKKGFKGKVHQIKDIL